MNNRVKSKDSFNKVFIYFIDSRAGCKHRLYFASFQKIYDYISRLVFDFKTAYICIRKTVGINDVKPFPFKKIFCTVIADKSTFP